MKKHFQFLYHYAWVGFHFIKSKDGLSLIYNWYLFLGYWELRRWHDLKAGEIETYNQKVQPTGKRG